MGRPFFKAFHTYFDYEAMMLEVGSSSEFLKGTIINLRPIGAGLDDPLIIILLVMAAILTMSGLGICILSLINKKSKIADRDSEEIFRERHIAEHEKYMSLVRRMVKPTRINNSEADDEGRKK